MTTLFVDTETTGLPDRHNGYQYHDPKEIIHYNNSRMIQMGYVICDSDGNVLKQVEYLIKPHKFTITNSNIHGIEHNFAVFNGMSIKHVLKRFYKDLKDVKIIVAHNIAFDINIILSECYRNQLLNIVGRINTKKIECTMEIGRHFLKTNKFPKLVELYSKLFNDTIKQDHKALSDAIVCKKCYYKMSNENIVNMLIDIKKNINEQTEKIDKIMEIISKYKRKKE